MTIELTNKELNDKFSTACNDLREENLRLSLRIGELASRIKKLEEKDG